MEHGVGIHVNRRSGSVRADELRRLLRLQGELSELPRGSEAQLRHAMSALTAMIGARVAIAVRVTGLRRGWPLLHEPVEQGFDSEQQRAMFYAYMNEAQRSWPDPSLGEVPRRMRPPVSTFLRDDLVDDRTWYRSPHVQELRRAGEVDSVVYTLHCQPESDGGMALAFHRAWGERGFGPHERNLVDVFCRESPVLRDREWADTTLDGFSPRLRQTLLALSRGLSEKQVASELALSAHTVHDYVKELHRRLGVQSRGELLARIAALRDGAAR